MSVSSINAGNGLARFIATLGPEARAAASGLEAARAGSRAAKIARESARDQKLAKQREVVVKLREMANNALLAGVYSGLAAAHQYGPGLAAGGSALGPIGSRIAAGGKLAASFNPVRIQGRFIEADKAQKETTVTYLDGELSRASDDVRTQGEAQSKSLDLLRDLLDAQHRAKQAGQLR